MQPGGQPGHQPKEDSMKKLQLAATALITPLGPTVATLAHANEALLTCLLMREAVYRKTMVSLNEILA